MEGKQDVTLEVTDTTGLDWDSIDESPIEASQEEAVAKEEESKEDVVEEAKAEAPKDQQPKEEVAEKQEEKKDADEKEADVKEEKTLSVDELPDDTKLKVKVDGELKEITLKEFKNGISGEKAIAKRFSEFDKKEKEFKKELAEINTYVSTFAQKMDKGDPVAALEYLAQFSKTPAYEVKDMLIKALLPEIERRQGLAPEELELEKHKAQLKYEKERIESEKKTLEAEQAKKDLAAKVESVRETHNISAEDWNKAFEYLDANLPTDKDITISTVKEYILFNRAEKALKSVDSKLVEDRGILDTLVHIQTSNPDFTEEDLQAIAKDAFGQAEKVVAEKELQEVAEKKQEVIETKQDDPKPIEELDPEDWDDIN